MKQLLCIAVGLIAAVELVCAGDPADESVTGVIAAMPTEMRILDQQLNRRRTETHLGVTFHTGTIEGRRVVLVTSGIGKVNAAKTATLLLDHFTPREVVFSGVAGGINPALAPGDIVIGVRTAQHDFGKATTQGFEPQPPDASTPMFIETPENLLALAEKAAGHTTFDSVRTAQGARLPRVIRGVIVTGDVFVSSPTKASELRQVFNADAVEMEGAAVAMVCWQQRVPCIIVRCVSDKADSMAWDDFERFIDKAANNSARLTIGMLKLLAEQKSDNVGGLSSSGQERAR